MIKSIRTAAFAGLIITASTITGCTMQSAIDKAISDSEKTFAIDFAKSLCDGTVEKFKPHFVGNAWENSVESFTAASPYCAKSDAQWEVKGYYFNAELNDTGSSKSSNITVIKQSTDKISMVAVQTNGDKESPKILAWTINAFDEKPPELVQIEKWDAMVPYLRVGGIIFLLSSIGFVIWFYRRSRRKARDNQGNEQ